MPWVSSFYVSFVTSLITVNIDFTTVDKWCDKKGWKNEFDKLQTEAISEANRELESELRKKSKDNKAFKNLVKEERTKNYKLHGQLYDIAILSARLTFLKMLYDISNGSMDKIYNIQFMDKDFPVDLTKIDHHVL